MSLQSHTSQASIPKDEISIRVDEMEEENSKRQKLKEAVHSISGGRYSPAMSTLNTTLDDVSDTQQRYYISKAKETIATSFSVITPGQEELFWKALQTEVLLDSNRDNQGKRKHFDPTVVLSAYLSRPMSKQVIGKQRSFGLFAEAGVLRRSWYQRNATPKVLKDEKGYR